MKLIDTIAKNSNQLVKLSKQNAPTIMVAVGVIGFVATVVTAAKAAPKAVEAKKELEEKIADEPKKAVIVKETVKAYTPVYAKTVVLGTLSIACVLGANHINNKRLAAVTTAYTLTDTAFREYKDKVIETIGKKKEQAVRDEIAADHVKENPIDEHNDIISISTGGSLFMDSISKQYFRSTREDIMRAAKNFERRLISGEDFLDFNEWLNAMDDVCTAGHVQNIQIGYNVGFNSTSGLDIYFSVTQAANGEPCTVVEYHTPPTYDMYL